MPHRELKWEVSPEMTCRTRLLSDLQREEISYLLHRQVGASRLSGMITVTAAAASPDLNQAKVF